MKDKELEKHLRKFQFKSIPAGLKNTIMACLENQYQYSKERILWIDRLWNWKWAVSTVTIVLVLLIFNFHMKGMQRYYEEIMPAVSYKEEMLDPDTEELFAFLDKNSEPSLKDYLRYMRQREKGKNFKNYILKIEELLG